MNRPLLASRPPGGPSSVNFVAPRQAFDPRPVKNKLASIDATLQLVGASFHEINRGLRWRLLRGKGPNVVPRRRRGKAKAIPSFELLYSS